MSRRTIPLSLLTSLVFLAAGASWLGWPLLRHDQVASVAGLDTEAPALTAAAASLLLLLAVARWLDDHRRFYRLGLLFAIVVVNVVVRLTLSPGMAGVEPVFVLPVLAGMAFGLSAGVLVGGASCLLSALVMGIASSALPGQTFAWALAGAAGGLLSSLGVRLASLLGVLMAWCTGPLTGLVLNAIDWPSRPAGEVDAFFPGLGPVLLSQRLVLYSYRTSFAVDGMRGVVTALGVSLLAPLLLGALRRAWGRPRPGGESPPATTVPAEALERREQVDRRRARERWLQHDPSSPLLHEAGTTPADRTAL